MILLSIFGFVSGIVSGMGIGGGIVLIPALTMILGFDQKIAQGITLLYFIPTAVFALIVHIKNKVVDFKIILYTVFTGIIGASVGAFCIRYFSSQHLSKIFSVFLLTVGIFQTISGLKQRN